MMKKQLMSVTVKGIRTENKLKQIRLDENFSCTRKAMKQEKSLQVWVFILSDYVQSPNHNHSLRNYATGLYIQHTLQNNSQPYTVCYTTCSFL